MLRDASIIHCDLKPENILLASPSPAGGNLGQLKLIDFGSACFEVGVCGEGKGGMLVLGLCPADRQDTAGVSHALTDCLTACCLCSAASPPSHTCCTGPHSCSCRSPLWDVPACLFARLPA